MSLPPTKATVLISGSGTNLQELIDQTSMPYLKIVRVISNKTGVRGLERAKEASIPTTYHNLVSGKYLKLGEKDPAVRQAAREKYDADLADLVMADQPDIIICAGWMHILAPTFIDPLTAKNIPIINLHPALPGQYDGASAIERAFDDFWAGKLENNKTGIMIHYVISEVDRGTPILVEEVECQRSDRLDGESDEEHKKRDLVEHEERMHKVEHRLIVEGTRMAIKALWAQRGNTNA